MTKRIKRDPTKWQAWQWKAGAILRCLQLCKNEKSKERFMAKELADAYQIGWLDGKTATDARPAPAAIAAPNPQSASGTNNRNSIAYTCHINHHRVRPSHSMGCRE